MAALSDIEFGADRPSTQAEIHSWRRTQLIMAALHCIAEGGLSKATVEEVTAKAKVSRGMVRHYFGSKDELLIASFRYFCDQFSNFIIEHEKSANESPLESLLFLVEYTFERERSNEIALECWFHLWNFAKLDERFLQIYREYYQWYREHVARLICRHLDLSEADPAAQAEIDGFVALTDGIWLELSIDPDKYRSDYAVEICRRYLLSASYAAKRTP